MRTLSILTTIIMLSLFSCKKKTDDSPKAKLQGKWKTTTYGYDANSNGTLESNETYPVADSITQYYSFSGDGTGTISQNASGGMTVSSPFTWTLTNNTDLVVQPTGSFYSTMNWKIQTLTSSDLSVTQTQSYGGASSTIWITFKKQ